MTATVSLCIATFVYVSIYARKQTVIDYLYVAGWTCLPDWEIATSRLKGCLAYIGKMHLASLLPSSCSGSTRCPFLLFSPLPKNGLTKKRAKKWFN